MTWTPEKGWTDKDGAVTSLAFPLSSLPPELRNVPRTELKFYSSVQVVSHGELFTRSFAQPVSHGTDFLIGGALPLRVAEFRGFLLPWSNLAADGKVERVEISVRSSGQTLHAAMRPTHRNHEFGMPTPVRLAFLAPENEKIRESAEAKVEFILANGNSVEWDDRAGAAGRLPLSVDLLLPKP